MITVKRWQKLLILVLCSSILLSFCIYWSLNPKERFQANKVPVLATPHVDIISVKDSPRQRGSFNVLLLGLDSWDKGSGRTDLVMLVNVNPITQKIKIISVPRDTRLLIENVGYTKINHAYNLQGVEEGIKKGTHATLKAVSSLFQVDINYYITINFAGFVHLVDYLGGLDIALPKPVRLTSTDITLPATSQKLDGRTALRLAWERKTLEAGDFDRQRHHLIIIKALGDKLSSQQLTRLPKLFKELRGLVETNFSEQELLSLAFLFQGLSMQDIELIKTPGKEDYQYDPVVKKRLFYWIPNLEEVQRISKTHLAN